MNTVLNTKFWGTTLENQTILFPSIRLIQDLDKSTNTLIVT